MKFKETEYEILLDEVTQGDVEKFFSTTRIDYPESLSYSAPEYHGVIVRTAMKVGWIKPEFDVAKANPALVKMLAGKINDSISGALEVSPN